MGMLGLYSMGSGCLNRPAEFDRTDSSSRSSGSSLPLSMEYMRWMVQMQTRAVVSICVALQALDDVFLAELEVVVGRDVLLEFLEGLVGEVAAVDQEQDAPRAGELDQPVDEGNRR